MKWFNFKENNFNKLRNFLLSVKLSFNLVPKNMIRYTAASVNSTYTYTLIKSQRRRFTA